MPLRPGQGAAVARQRWARLDAEERTAATEAARVAFMEQADSEGRSDYFRKLARKRRHGRKDGGSSSARTRSGPAG